MGNNLNRRTIEMGLLALLHSLQHVYLYALPPLYLLLRAEFNVSTFQIGLLGSVSGVISIFQGPAGYLVERFGSKRLAVLSMLCCSAAVFLYSLAPFFEFLLVIAALFALSQVVFHPATYAMVTQRASASNKAKYIAYHQVGGFIGSAVGTIVIAALASMIGWRSTLQIIPVVGLCIIFLFWKFVKDETHIIQQSNPASTDPIPSESTEFRFTIPLFILILSISILSLGNLQNFIPLFLTEAYGENVVWAGILTGVMIAVGSVASLLGGALSDKYDKTLIMMSANLGLAITTILLALGQFTSAALLLTLILYGVARYLPVPAQHALSNITAAEHPQGIGFSYTGIALGQVISAPLIGYLIDSLGVRTTFLVFSVFPLISIIILIVFRKYVVNGLEVGSN
jgi:FSR family fosmidomycin resistance protein-like MFS transporter